VPIGAAILGGALVAALVVSLAGFWGHRIEYGVAPWLVVLGSADESVPVSGLRCASLF
jgi:hypothetical protein